MTEFDANTFDIADMLSGNKFPEKMVPIYVNEEVSYRVAEIEERIQADPENEGLEAEREALHKEAQNFRFEVHLRGVPRDKILTAVEQIEEQYPSEYSALGRRKPNAEADHAMSLLQWALYIQKIVSPTGAVADSLSDDEVENMRRGLPAPAIQAIEEGISALQEKTRSGHEALAMETDFLSKR